METNTRHDSIVERKVMGFLALYNHYNSLTEDDKLTLKCLWGLLDTDEQIHMVQWCSENLGSMPNFLRVQ